MCGRWTEGVSWCAYDDGDFRWVKRLLGSHSPDVTAASMGVTGHADGC